MSSYHYWEYKVAVCQHQHFTSPMRPKKSVSLIFGDVIASKYVMAWISCALLTDCDWTRPVNAIASVLYGCHSNFEFTIKVSTKKIEIPYFKAHVWDLIKHLVTPVGISVFIWSYTICCGIPRFCKAIKRRALLTPMYSAFETWWHTRRNQISPLAETDESI